MKISSLLAWFVPELRKRTWSQLLKLWGHCSPYSRNSIYVHIVLLLACASVIFNLTMRLRGPLLLDMLGLAIGVIVPPNIYFYAVFDKRRAALREFIEAHWEEFNE